MNTSCYMGNPGRTTYVYHLYLQDNICCSACMPVLVLVSIEKYCCWHCCFSVFGIARYSPCFDMTHDAFVSSGKQTSHFTS